MVKSFQVLAGVVIVWSLQLTFLAAQVDHEKTEVGVQFSFIQQSGRTSNITSRTSVPSGITYFSVPVGGSNEPGFGWRIGYNLLSYLDVEGQIDFFPSDRLGPGKILTAVAGVKAGPRRDRFGIFGKIRPGLAYFSREENRCGRVTLVPGPAPPNAAPLPCDRGGTHFALDVGAVMEFYPSRHALLRVDLGDTLIHTGEKTIPFPIFTVGVLPGQVAPTELSLKLGPSTSHNFQLSVGVGLKF